ncbi:MAG: hypothetical protein WB473_09500 [Pedococcus sp.]
MSTRTRVRSPWRRSVTRCLGVGATTALAVSTVPLSAAHADSHEAPSQLDSTRVECVEADGRVEDIKILGSTVYVGGQFSSVSAGGTTYPRSRAAAFDLATCAVLPWNPSVVGTVLAIAPTSSAVYLGGDITSVGGQSRSNLAAVDPVTGAVSAFSPTVKGSVAELATSASRLYAAGGIRKVDGQQRSKAAAFSLGSGTLDAGWHPAADSQVKGLAVSPDATRVYLAGSFDTINGTAARHLAAVGAADGELDPAFDPELRVKATEVLAVGSQVVVAYAGPGGQVGVMDTTGVLQASAQTNGNAQAVAVAGTEVFGGGHFGRYCGTSGSSCSDFTKRRKALSIDSGTSALTDFHPRLDSALGVWAMAYDPGTGRLVIGGDFTKSGSRPTAHLAVFGS